LGGIYSHILQEFSHLDIPLSRFHSVAIPDTFAEHGTVDELKEDLGLSTGQILARVLKIVRDDTLVSKTPHVL